ncbi:MAG: M48 family metalloprotease [Steroidobacteraceae bacterium]
MDFFAAQASARQQSRLLTVAFALCVAAVILVLNVIVLFTVRIFTPDADGFVHLDEPLSRWALQHPGYALLTTLLVGGFIGIASFYRMLQLRSGGGYVARSVGGVRVDRSTQDARRRMLHNVVDEMALASGVPAPEVYVLENEDGINAFAAGHTPANAAIAVTRGALLRLNREQLQGVVAHEFSHILNGDMRLSIRLMGLIFGLMAVALAGRTLLRLARHADRGAVPAFVVGALVAIVGQIGWWGGRLLQAWISRKREGLADASAVQFTRNPEGLKEALIRVAAMGENRRFASSSMEQVAHMLFTQGGRRLLATHPPLLERLQALDPHINAEELAARKRLIQKQWAQEQIGRDTPPPAPRRAPDGVPVPAAAALIAATAGDPGPRHLDHALALRRALPEALRGSAAAPEQARGQILALALASDPGLRERQLQHIAARQDADTSTAVRAALPAALDLPPLLRLPAVLQLLPTLRALPAAERLALHALLHELMRMDGTISAFDYALDTLVTRVLAAQLAPHAPGGNATLTDVEPQLGIVFAVLAQQGSRNAEEARRAYEAGLAPLLPQHRPAYGVLDSWPQLLDGALAKLATLRPAAKQLLVEGLVRTIAHDAMLAPAEAELLRTICAVLEVPLPPVLPEPAET